MVWLQTIVKDNCEHTVPEFASTLIPLDWALDFDIVMELIVQCKRKLLVHCSWVHKYTVHWFLSTEHWILTGWWSTAAGCEPPQAGLYSTKWGFVTSPNYLYFFFVFAELKHGSGILHLVLIELKWTQICTFVYNCTLFKWNAACVILTIIFTYISQNLVMHWIGLHCRLLFSSVMGVIHFAFAGTTLGNAEPWME